VFRELFFSAIERNSSCGEQRKVEGERKEEKEIGGRNGNRDKRKKRREQK
jgi:hypothetical protein